MSNLIGYFDDSGTHDSSPVVVVAGWVAPELKWKRFIREWHKARNEYGFNVLHTTEMMANNRRSEFADKSVWTDNKKFATVRRLRQIVLESVIHGFSMSVPKPDYEELFKPEFYEKCGGPYTYAVRSMIGFVEKWRMANKVSEPIQYIFDNLQGQTRKEIEGVFDGATKAGGSLEKYGITPQCHSFRDKKVDLPLQAADLWAWTVFKRDKARFERAEMEPFPVETFNFFVQNKGLLSSKYQTREQLKELADANPSVAIEEDRRIKPTPKGTTPRKNRIVVNTHA
ncbi:DUF3800 domain-containing protein [Terriglobus tenax]|uniref:DUF3800 domain-containing protein n=1 Tax=Terriglobus tenax TaxID=1111115 RepID=UPI0021DF42E7|nr:DUF3800 domain-containing protein [Terriglobus tenax]